VAFLSDFVWYGGVVLQIAVLYLLIRGPFSRYFPLFLYGLTSVALTLSLVWIYRVEGWSPRYYSVFWGGELLSDLLLFFLIISLTSRALEGSPLRPKLVRVLTGITFVALAASLIMFKGPTFSMRWNQSVSQLLNFGAAIMVMVLWTSLVATKMRDRQLLKVSAGLGMMVASAAIFLGVRSFTGKDDVLRTVADYFYRITQVAGPAIWCWAFRPAKPVKKNDGTPVREDGTDTPPEIATTPSAS
jgi:hypothetical protein